MPNITGAFGKLRLAEPSPVTEGAFRFNRGSNRATAEASGSNQSYDELVFDASLSDKVYGSSTHVTPSNLSIKIWQRIS